MTIVAFDEQRTGASGAASDVLADENREVAQASRKANAGALERRRAGGGPHARHGLTGAR